MNQNLWKFSVRVRVFMKRILLLILIVAFVGLVFHFAPTGDKKATENITVTNPPTSQTSKDILSLQTQLADTKKQLSSSQISLQESKNKVTQHENEIKELKNKLASSPSQADYQQISTAWVLSQQQLKQALLEKDSLVKVNKQSESNYKIVIENYNGLWSAIDKVTTRTDETTTTNLTAEKRANFYEMWSLWLKTVPSR